MGPVKRADAAGAIYYMFNRANRTATMFEKEADFEAFERLLVDASLRHQTIELLVLDGKTNRMISESEVCNGLVHSPQFGRRYSPEAAGHGAKPWSEP